ncbi:MAG: hypothetical protein NZZ60_03360 [Bacteroidia bacterium]|nr:hypothetical protein [Bacteroidia bacterium]MCX7652542.1 hypothetical protein [Bacteroidia bacterium]MDW8417525.1 hypothetical protein [Bacteroidia bacterium]
MTFVYLLVDKSTKTMKTQLLPWVGAALLLFIWSCGSGRSVTASRNDTYLTAKERSKLNQQAQSGSYTADGKEIDARADNYEENASGSRRRDWEDDDYTYSRRIRRYSTGVWYDPWFDPWCAPGWGWRSSWWGPSWGWGGMWAATPGWYYTPGWGWSYYAGYWGPSYYAGPAWWGDRGWSSPAPRRTNYAPRTYTTPRATTTYTPPRGGSMSPSTPPRRSAAPSSAQSPSGSRPAPSSGIRSSSVPAGPRPSTPGVGSGSGGIRTSTGTSRPR